MGHEDKLEHKCLRVELPMMRPRDRARIHSISLFRNPQQHSTHFWREQWGFRYSAVGCQPDTTILRWGTALCWYCAILLISVLRIGLETSELHRTVVGPCSLEDRTIVEPHGTTYE